MNRRFVSLACLLTFATIVVAQAPPPTGNKVEYSAGYPKAVAGRKVECKGTYTEGAGPPKWKCESVTFQGTQSITVRGVTRNYVVNASIEQQPVPSPFELDVAFSTTDPVTVSLSGSFMRVVVLPSVIRTEYDTAGASDSNLTPLP